MKTLVIFPNTNGFCKFIMQGLKYYGPDVIGFYRFSNSFILNIMRILSIFNIQLPKAFVWGEWRKLKGYSTIILFAECAQEEVVNLLNQNNPNSRKIYYMWNIKTSIPKYISSDKSWELWSFDKSECIKYGWHHANQFYPSTRIDSKKKKYDVCFCGYNKGRKSILEELAFFFQSKKISYKLIIREWGLKNWISSLKHAIKDVKITPFETDYLSYLEIVSQSECILDLVQKEQVGLTMRAMESLFYEKKLLTNNLDIISYPFYRPENIFILGKDNINNLELWLNTPMDTNYSVQEYTISNWYKKMGLSPNLK